MPFAWSWSALESFETCPKKHWHLKVKKDYIDPPGEAQTWGTRVHAAMADRISKGRRLPDTMPYEKHIDDVMQNSDRTKVVVKTEQELVVTEDMTPCKWFDKKVDPWLRVKADVLKINTTGRVARVVDWKTGKGKFHTDEETGKPVADDPGQLQLSAALVFNLYPEVDAIRAQYHWLGHDVITEEGYVRPDAPRIWSRFLPRVDRMEKAYSTTDYPPKPSGLCKKHCPVTSCPYHGVGNR